MVDRHEYAPLRDVSLAEQVANVIRHAILTGKLVPGDKVTEEQLARELGVSRLPIREAIRTLQQQGLLDVRPRRGAFVRHLDAKVAEDTLAVRTGLQMLAVEQVFAKLNEAEWEEFCCRLETALEPMRALLKGYDTRPNIQMETARLDIAWWSVMIQAADNEVLSRLWEDVALLNRILMRNLVGLPSIQNWRDTIEGHQEIIDTFRTRVVLDCTRAVRLREVQFYLTERERTE